MVAAHCVLFALSLIGTYAHQAMVRHGYCTDHGELIHAPARRHLHSHDAHHPAVTRSSTLEGTHGCAVLEFLTHTAQAQPGSRATSEICPSQGAFGRPSTRLHTSIPLVLQSPKHSPPAA